MRSTRVLSAVAATLLLGAGAAAAQGATEPVRPERAPATLQNAPAEKVAPPMNAGEQVPVGTTGQGATPALKPGSGANTEPKTHGTVGVAPQKEESGGKAGLKAEGNSRSESGDTTLKSDSSSKTEINGTDTDASGSATKSATDRNGTTGQGAAAGAGKLTTGQRTRITTAIRQQKVEPAQVNFSVNVGTQIPARVRYHPLPVEVVEVYPEWRGYYYILVSDRIVIIEPDTRAVVFIIEA